MEARTEEAGLDDDGDEEGRFFGGGITKNTAEILDFMDEQPMGEAGPEKIDAAWVRKLAVNFERRISTNAELRAKFESDPQKFMGSEADLDADIKALSILSEHPELFGEFVRLGCVGSLVGLLSHENTDIAIGAIQIISELIDDDVESNEEQWDLLVQAMLNADLLDLLVQNFARLDESNESDRSGVYHALNVLEHLASNSAVAKEIGSRSTLLSWLLQRMKQTEELPSQNKQYAAELLEILVQSIPVNRTRLAELDGVDALLQLLSIYRKRDPPKDTEEEEYMENLFDCLTCLVQDSVVKSKFIDAEGVELCLIMLREGKKSKPRALRLLDHALQGSGGGAVGEQLVEAAGLKTISAMIMKKACAYGSSTEHVLGILSALLQSLPADSPARIRTLAKFVEKGYEKTERLMQLRREPAARLKQVDETIAREKADADPDAQDDMADEWFSRRLDAGLFSVQ
ncbi:MAG: hypothetical protein M1826_004031, partial [Phylliscum demangeonii]